MFLKILDSVVDHLYLYISRSQFMNFSIYVNMLDVGRS